MGQTDPDWLTGHFGDRRAAVVIGVACGLAWSSHILLDWLGADANPPYGVQALWPFSDTWFFSRLDIFPGTQRRDPLSMRGDADQSARGGPGNRVADGIGPLVAAWWLSAYA